MEIRSFREGDGDAVRTFWLACGLSIRLGDDDRSLARFAKEGRVLLAFEGGARIVGSAMAGWDGRRGWIYHVATHPDERRRGIGTELVKRVEEWLASVGCPRINLLVEDKNTWGMQFWEALGYGRASTVEYGKAL